MVRSVTVINLVKNTWASLGSSTRRICGTMWLLSFTVISLGIIGDDRGWWLTRPFLTSLVSSLSGALFGIPVAIVFIQRISHGEGQRREQQETLDVARRFATDLLYKVIDLAPTWPDIDIYLALEQQMIDVSATRVPDFRQRIVSSDSFLSSVETFIDACHIFETSTLDPDETKQALVRISTTVAFLVDYVSPRMIDAGLPVVYPYTRAISKMIDSMSASAFEPWRRRLLRAGQNAPILLSTDPNPAIGADHVRELVSVAHSMMDNAGPCALYMDYLLTLLKETLQLCRSIDVPDPAALLGYGLLDQKLGEWAPSHASMSQFRIAQREG